MFRPSKIISGGHDGVDRAALDTARECGVPIGGWVPAGSLAPDGTLNPTEFPELRESESKQVEDSTEANVRDSDATLILIDEAHLLRSPATRRAREITQAADKQFLILSDIKKTPEEQLTALRLWLSKHQPETLYITGPSQSEQPDRNKLTRHLILRLFDRVSEPKEDRLLQLTTWSLITIFTALAFLVTQINQPFDFIGVLVVLCVGLTLRRGSHKALRFLTFVYGFGTFISLSDVVYHLILFKPYEMESGNLLPPDSPEFWIYLITPSFLSLGLLALLILVHRQRQIHFLTRTVKRWAIAFAVLTSFTLILNQFRSIDNSPPELTETQDLQIERIINFYKKHGSSPPTVALDNLAIDLQKSEIVGRVAIGEIDSGRASSSPSRTPYPLLKNKVNSSNRSGDKLTLFLDDEAVWTGIKYQRAVRLSTNDWFLLDVYIGGYQETNDSP